MGRVVLSCAVWRVEDREGGWKEEPLLSRKRKLGPVWLPLLPTQPPSQGSFTLRSALPQGQLLPTPELLCPRQRTSCSPLLCCSAPGRGPSCFHLFKFES